MKVKNDSREDERNCREALLRLEEVSHRELWLSVNQLRMKERLWREGEEKEELWRSKHMDRAI